MDVTGYSETLARTLLETACLGDERTQDVARSLVVALDPALRLAAVQMLSDAAAQVEDEADGVRVTVVMEGATPHLVVTERPRPVPGPLPLGGAPSGGGAPAPSSVTGGATASQEAESGPSSDDNDVRTTLRMSASLKAQVDAAAQAQERSVNAWLLDAVRAGLREHQARPGAYGDCRDWDGPGFRSWAGAPYGSGGAGSGTRRSSGRAGDLQGWFG